MNDSNKTKTYALDLNDTTLFRTLAERMMTKENPSDPNLPTKAWSDTTSSSNKLMMDDTRSQSRFPPAPGLLLVFVEKLVQVLASRTFRNHSYPYFALFVYIIYICKN